ncbi:hypothetical protein ACFRAM_28600 [Paenibacillus sp. NPDC056722]|uniref:hypothetical protein n=1 Tax=Paenibacillus sp. NPDC056722 TaxID=3345924 RepID=UPI0036B1C958
MSPEQITALFGGTVAVLGAIFGYLNARQSRRADERDKRYALLEQRVAHLEAELAESKSLFREAIRFIRGLLSHIAELALAHRLGAPAPQTPDIPERLREEV